MATLLEILGEGTFAKLLQAVDVQPTAARLAAPQPPHQYATCKSPSKCEQHRRVYRRLLKARKDHAALNSGVTRSLSLSHLALEVLALDAATMSDTALDEMAAVARIDPNPTRLETVTRGTALQTAARRHLYRDGGVPALAPSTAIRGRVTS